LHSPGSKAYSLGLSQDFVILVFALLNIVLINYLLSDFRAPQTADTYDYNIAVAKYFLGQGEPQMWRILKPIYPAVIALVSPVFGHPIETGGQTNTGGMWRTGQG